MILDWKKHEGLEGICLVCKDRSRSSNLDNVNVKYKRFWATDCHEVFRVIAGRGFMGHLIVMFCYYFLRLKQIKWLHSFYRRIRMGLRRLKQSTA